MESIKSTTLTEHNVAAFIRHSITCAAALVTECQMHLLSLASMDVMASVKTDSGTKYVIFGDITGPGGRLRQLLCNRYGYCLMEVLPRLVTVYLGRYNDL